MPTLPDYSVVYFTLINLSIDKIVFSTKQIFSNTVKRVKDNTLYLNACVTEKFLNKNVMFTGFTFCRRQPGWWTGMNFFLHSLQLG